MSENYISSIADAKAALRSTLRDARRARVGAVFAFDAPDVVAEWRRIAQAATVIASYQPARGEADPAPIIAALARRDVALCFPWHAARGDAMRFASPAPGTGFCDGPYGVPQPEQPQRTSAPDIILTPLVGFDRRGGRLGQGGGHYDRAFTAYPDATRIGIAWCEQEVASVPLNSWDQPLHLVITPNQIITMESRAA